MFLVQMLSAAKVLKILTCKRLTNSFGAPEKITFKYSGVLASSGKPVLICFFM